MKFSIIHASYGRPEMAFETAQKWISFAGQRSIQYFLSVDVGDKKFNDYKYLYDAHIFRQLDSRIISDFIIDESWILRNNFFFIDNNTNTSVAAINNAARHSIGDIIIVISDDFEPIPNWDLEILKAVEGKTDWILKTQDGTQDWIITLPIMDRAYYNRFGYIYYPEYTHMFCDTEMSGVADMTGRRLTSNLLFKHNHYSVGGIQKDATSDKADRTWNQGEQLFIERAERNFDLINPLPSKRTLETVAWCKNRKK